MPHMKSKSITQLLTELRETVPTLANVSIALPTTQYTYALPTDTKALQFQCRTANDVLYAFEDGKVPSGGTAPYGTLKSGAVWYKESLNLTAATLHVAAAASALVVEVEAWGV